MAETALINEWWQEPGAGDKSLEEDHQDFYKDVLEEVIDIDLGGKTVLDFGCNRGVLLRKLYDEFGLKKGVGIDLAKDSIETANQNKGDRPLEYFAKTSLEEYSADFDVALSTAVIYLIDDIEGHARQMYQALKPGGIYFVTHPDYTQSKGGRVLTDAINKFAAVKASSNTMDEIVTAFCDAGFEVGLKKMQPSDYFPVAKHSEWFESVYDKIHHEYNERYALRCVKNKK